MGGRKPAVAPLKVIDAIVHFKNKVIYTDVCNGEISEYFIYNLIYNILLSSRFETCRFCVRHLVVICISLLNMSLKMYVVNSMVGIGLIIDHGIIHFTGV